MTLALLFNLFTTFGAVILIILASFIFISSYSKNPKLVKTSEYFTKYSIRLVLIASFVAVAGSLVYSEIFKFEPCVLCWWQRIFIYPVFFISLVAVIKKSKNPFQYINPLMWIALLFSLYHNYLIIASNKANDFICDPGAAASCDDRYVKLFSVIDIPFMALAIILFILVLTNISLKNLSKNEKSS